MTERSPQPPEEADPFADMARMAVSLAVGFMLDEGRQRHGPESAAEDTCYANAQMRRVKGRLLELVGKLPERERALITAHYFEDRPFEEIAEDMQVSKGRVSQLHKKALNLLLERYGTSHYTDWSV